MASRTVALQESTYERLKAARRPGESFTEVVDRLLQGKEPSLLDFVGLLSRDQASELAGAIEAMRAEDAHAEERRWTRRGRAHRRSQRGRDL